MSQGPDEAATERELVEDGLSGVTFESDTEMKLKKKTTLKAPKSPKSPYLSRTNLHSKGILRSFNGTERKHFEIPLLNASRQLWRGSYHQGTWLGPAKSDPDMAHSLPGRTPEYLKEALGMKKPKHARSSNSGYIPGTPDYKEKEEMYDEIIELKKTVQAQKCEADRMKTKLRRLEEENNRKDKQIEQLLDSSKCSEFGWARTEQKNDTIVTIRGLKQKILKLEQQCKEKDNTINKLQTDVKSTNAEEMRIALQSYYEEIQRLQTLLAKSKTVQRKPPPEKQQKALNAAVLQLSKNIQRLQDENWKLKADLDHALGSTPTFGKSKNYTEWSRQRLVRRISNLEKKMEEIENDTWPLSERSTSPSLTPLVFVPVDRSAGEQWDPQEDCEHLCKAAKKLKDQSVVLQNQLAAKEEEIQKLTGKVKELEERREPFCQPAGMAATASPRQPQGSLEHLRQDRAAQIIQKQWKAYRTKNPGLSLGPQSSKVALDGDPEEEAVLLIQSVFRAHQMRTQLAEGPLIFSPGSESANPAASRREEKLTWSPFKSVPLLFTSADPETSFQDHPDSSRARPTQEVHSDDSDEIITVAPVKKTPSLDFTVHLGHPPLHT